MPILSSIFWGLEFWSVNHSPIYENSESIFLKNKEFLGEIYVTDQKGLLGANADKSLELHW